MRSLSANVRALSAILLVVLWSVNPLLSRAQASRLADEPGGRVRDPYEVRTRETTYATRDGVSAAAAPSFKLTLKTLNGPDPRPRARGESQSAGRAVAWSNAGGKAVDEFTVSFGESHVTYRSSGDKMDKIEGPPIPKSFLFAAGAILTLVVATGGAAAGPVVAGSVSSAGLAKAGAVGVAVIGSINPLTALVEGRTKELEAAAKNPGWIWIILPDGSMRRTPYVAPNYCGSGLGCLGGYIYRDFFMPGGRNELGAYVVGQLVSLNIKSDFPLVEVALGEFASTLTEQVVQNNRGARGKVGYYDPASKRWIPSTLTTTLNSNSLKAPEITPAPEGVQPPAIAPGLEPASLVPPSASPALGLQPAPPAPARAAPLRPLTVTTYQVAPPAPARAAEVPQVSSAPVRSTPVETVSSVPDEPVPRSNRNLNLPKGVSGGSSFGSFNINR